MEDGHGDRPIQIYSNYRGGVLILVLVEDGLGEYESVTRDVNYKGLNPCFSGGWSRSTLEKAIILILFKVLILVLVEDGLGAFDFNVIAECADGLNPCFSGGWSRRATLESVCQRDCYNNIFDFVNVWRPKICTFSGVITDANLRIFDECEHVFRGYFGVFLCRCLIKKVGT